MVLTAYVVLSPVTGLFCHRRQRIKFCLSPVGPTQLRELDASVGASGPHDFAVREKRLSSARRGIAQESFDSPCDPIARKTLPRPPHPHPASVTIMIRPLWGGMARLIKMFLPTMEAKYFCKWGWTPLSTNRPTGKSPHGSESKFRSCPGRGAAPFRAAPQSRDLSRRCEMDPGSAAHRCALLSRGTPWPRRRFIRRV